MPGWLDNPDASTEWACARKKAYLDERVAKRVAAAIREGRGGDGRGPGDVTAYGCTRCGQYHVGRTPGAA